MNVFYFFSLVAISVKALQVTPEYLTSLSDIVHAKELDWLILILNSCVPTITLPVVSRLGTDLLV